MNSISGLKQRRELADCFCLQIPLDRCEEEIKVLVHYAKRVEVSTQQMLNGNMSIEDLLESVEDIFPSMDEYLVEVERNLNDTLILFQEWQQQ